MKRSILIKSLIPILLSLFLLGIPVNAFACGRLSTVIRPLSDWELNNPRIIYGYGVGDYLIYFSNSRQSPDPEYEYIDWGPNPPPPECYDGYIKERVLRDGSAELTLHIEFWDLRAWCYHFVDYYPEPSEHPWLPVRNIFESGEQYEWEPGDSSLKMSGIIETKFILPEPGAEIPLVFEMTEYFTFDCVLCTGTGIFSESSSEFGFTPGATGRVSIVEIGFLTWSQGFIYPIDSITVREIS